jgi:NIMA (never in mitosis gene a)-related kinase
MTDSSMDDFIIEKVLGKGSFGSVYLVRRKEDNKIYALKSVILEKLNQKEQRNSVNEVRILASVNHPNVIGYKEAFWDDNAKTLNIVMEYADDGDLQTKIGKMRKEGGMFQESLIWSYSIQMIEGLKALHDKKIMHRDLKSANIFLVKDQHQCKIGDMNVSKVIKEKELLTQTGTPYYASPEVWRDEPYSYKSDLWSIGCVIYELCALRPPFKGKDLDELFLNVCKGKVDRISHVYSDDLWKMILMLLQVEVKKRCDCDKFLNSKLITRKIQEMKNENNDYRNLEKNKEINDGNLLDTIKFDNILDIKKQLPTKKNYDHENLNSNKGNTKKIIKKKDINTNNNEERNRNKLNNNAIEQSNSIKYHKIINKPKKKILKNRKNKKIIGKRKG